MTAGVAALMFLTGVLLALSVAIATRHRAEQAADLAALAGAAAQQQGADACAAASRVASANGAVLISCSTSVSREQAGVPLPVVAVTVSRGLPVAVARWVHGQAVARARAGPAG